MIGSGWQTFVQVGLTLARIRDGELFKTEYDSFEAYYRVKWQSGRHDVNRLISAAQVFTDLVTISHQKPEHETQVRPLVGLTAEQAQKAWDHAIEKAAGRKKWGWPWRGFAINVSTGPSFQPSRHIAKPSGITAEVRLGQVRNPDSRSRSPA